MRLLSPGHHRILDFITVAVFAVAPILFHFTGAPGFLSYALALIHLSLTLATRFSEQETHPVPFALHGIVEGVVGPVLILLPLVTGWAGTVRLFYFTAGIVILGVWALTAYRTPVTDRGD